MKRAVIGENGCVASLHDSDEHALAELAHVEREHEKRHGECCCRVDDVADSVEVGDKPRLPTEVYG